MPNYAAVMKVPELKVYASIRNAIKAASALNILDSTTQFVVRYGNMQTATEGHHEVRAYDTFEFFSDADALLAGSSVWMKNAIARAAQPPVMVCRAELGLTTVLLIRELPPSLHQSLSSAMAPTNHSSNRNHQQSQR